MPERRVCSFSGDEIEPGTGLMFVKKMVPLCGSKIVRQENSVKLKRNPRKVKWTRHFVRAASNNPFLPVSSLDS